MERSLVIRDDSSLAAELDRLKERGGFIAGIDFSRFPPELLAGLTAKTEDLRFPNEATSRMLSPDGKIVDLAGREIAPRMSSERRKSAFEALKRFILLHASNSSPVFPTSAFPHVRTLLESSSIQEEDNMSWANFDYVDIAPLEGEKDIVIIPVRDDEEEFEKNLREWSVLQKGIAKGAYRILVVNNRLFGEPPNEKIRQIVYGSEIGARIDFIDVELPPGMGVGAGRHIGYSTGIAMGLERALRLGANYPEEWVGYLPLYMTSSDSDDRPDRYTIRTACTMLDENPGLDCVTGNEWRISPEIACGKLPGDEIAGHDYCLVDYMLEKAFMTVLESQELWDPFDVEGVLRKSNLFANNRYVTSGWAGSTFTDEAVALIGGGFIDLKMWEDQGMGQAISLLRGQTRRVKTKATKIDGQKVYDWDQRLIPFVRTIGRMKNIWHLSPFARQAHALSLGEIMYGGGYIARHYFNSPARKEVTDEGVLRMSTDLRKLDASNILVAGPFQKRIELYLGLLRNWLANGKEFYKTYGPRFLKELGLEPGDYEIIRSNPTIKPPQAPIVITPAGWVKLEDKIEETKKFVEEKFGKPKSVVAPIAPYLLGREREVGSDLTDVD